MATVVTGTRAEIGRLSRAIDQALGLPRQGTTANGQPHPRSPSSPPGFGWTVRHANVRKHPTLDLYSYLVTPEVEALDGQTIRTADGNVTINLSGAVTRDDALWDDGEMVRE